jgi:hypothetical protein
MFYLSCCEIRNHTKDKNTIEANWRFIVDVFSSLAVLYIALCESKVLLMTYMRESSWYSLSAYRRPLFGEAESIGSYTAATTCVLFSPHGRTGARKGVEKDACSGSYITTY